PRAASSFNPASHAAPASSSRSTSWSARGTPMRNAPLGVTGVPDGTGRAGGDAIVQTADAASATVRVNTDTQSSDTQAGTVPSTGTRPTVGFMPTRPQSAAGTRPEPAVSVPMPMSARS